MLGNVDVTKDALLTARTLLVDVYRSNGRHQRERIRGLKRIINLAKERGFNNEQALMYRVFGQVVIRVTNARKIIDVAIVLV